MFTAVSALEYVKVGNTSGKCIYWRWQLLILPTASAVICADFLSAASEGNL